MEFELKGVKFRLDEGEAGRHPVTFISVWVKNTSGGCAAPRCMERGQHWCIIWSSQLKIGCGVGRAKAWLKKYWDALPVLREPNKV